MYKISETITSDLAESLNSFLNTQVRPLHEVLVDRENGFKFYIYSKEHPPPHFHVKYDGEDNSFDIENGNPLYPNNGLRKYFKKINEWHRKNKPELVDIWNKYRPSNCPVGRIE